MVPRLEKLDAVVEHLIDQPVHCSDPARPHIAAQLLEMLRFSDSFKWLTYYRVHEIQNAQGSFAVRVHPVMQVVAALIP